jgi:hypothetical protein
MSQSNSINPDDALRQREELLRQRELELRIRELESELKTRGSNFHPASEPTSSTTGPAGAQRPDPAVNPTSKYKGKSTRWDKWNGKLWMGLQFVLVVIAVIAAIKIAHWLGGALIIGMIAWVAYKVFFETD